MRYIYGFVLSLLLFQTTLQSQNIEAIIFNGAGKPAEEKLIAMTIAGIVNRETPNLFLMNVYETWSYNQTDETWRDIYVQEGQVNFTTINDIQDLIDQFAHYLNGAITYDPDLLYGNFPGQSFRWQAETAAMVAGLSDCIPLPYNNSSIEIIKPDSVWVDDHFHGQETLKIPAKLELPNHPWNNTDLPQEERYLLLLDWAMENLLDRTNPGSFYLREITDWSIQQRMFQMNLAGTESLNFYSLSDAKAGRIEQVMTYLRNSRPDTLFHVYGWMRPEPLVQWVSAWGGSFHETLMGNLSWHHIFPADEEFQYDRPSLQPAEEATLEDKHYVLVLGSEGDAGNWVVGFQSGAWLSDLRGTSPVGWGFNLHMFDQFPFLAQYYYQTATASDGFVAVTSPVGYAYPDVLPDGYYENAIAQSAALLEKYNIPTVYAYKHYNGAGVSTYRDVEISNNFKFPELGGFYQATQTPLTILFDPALQTQTAYDQYGGLLYNHVNDNTFYANVTNLNTSADRIIQKLKGEARPSFLLSNYQRFRQDGTSITANNPADITLQRLQQMQQMVMNDSQIGEHVEFVTPEKFTALLQKHLTQTNVQDQIDEGQYPDVKVFIDRNQQMHIQWERNIMYGVQLQIFDVTGRLMHGEYVNPSTAVVDLQGLEQGAYVVRLSAKDYVWSKKILVR